jgi:hypothetical protein
VSAIEPRNDLLDLGDSLFQARHFVNKRAPQHLLNQMSHGPAAPRCGSIEDLAQLVVDPHAE